MKRVNPYEEEEIKRSSLELKERNDCTVVALSIVTGRCYKDCMNYLKSKGRVRGCGMTAPDLESALFGMKKYKVVKGPYDRKNKITVNKFIEKHPKGVYYCVIRGHAFAIVDGVVYDHNTNKTGRRQIYSAYRIYKKEKK